MLKKVLGSIFALSLFAIPMNANASTEAIDQLQPTPFEYETMSTHSWSISDRSYGSGQPYLISQGNINKGLLDLKYDGYASVVWPGGYGDNLTMFVSATASTTYLSGSTTSTPDSTTRITPGETQTVTSVPVKTTHSALYATGAKVFARGSIESTNKDWFYYYFSGSGNHGV